MKVFKYALVAVFAVAGLAAVVFFVLRAMYCSGYHNPIC